MFELFMKYPCLNCIKPSIVAFHIVVIFLGLSMVSNYTYLSCDFSVTRCNCPCLSKGTKIFPWIEAEGSGMAYGAGLSPYTLPLPPPPPGGGESLRQGLRTHRPTAVFHHS